MFQQPGCVDDGWGAAWYELSDEKAKAQRYRLTKLRLWKGRRAKPRALVPHKIEGTVEPSQSPPEVDSVPRIVKNQAEILPV